MTKDRAKKRAIRARMDKTHEDYSTAHAHVAAAHAAPVDEVLIHPASAGTAWRLARGPGQQPHVIVTRCVLSTGREQHVEREQQLSFTGRRAYALKNAVNLFFTNSTAKGMSSEVPDDFPSAALDAENFEQLARSIGPDFGFIHEPGSPLAICFGRGRVMPAPNPSGGIGVFTFSDRGQMLWSSTALFGIPARNFREAVNAFVPSVPRAPLRMRGEELGDDWGRTLDDVWHLVAVLQRRPDRDPLPGALLIHCAA